jgi:uncharacterized damage-inducible protein DinB
MIDELLEAWRINNRINLRLIKGISDAGMKCTLSKRGGRNVVRQLAHLQYVRVHQLTRRAKPLAKGARTFDTYDEPDRATLTAALRDSSARVQKWIRMAHEGAPGIRTMKRGLAPTVAYLISHESHHRGSILLTLKQCGEPVDRATSDAIKDWNKI